LSSSTSSSDRRRPATFAGVALVVSILCVLEVVTRIALVPVSVDLSRLVRYPSQARSLCDRAEACVVFVGNSATERGVDPELFGRLLGVKAGLFVADASHINTWIWMINRQFWKQGVSPALVVINFFGDSLGDGQPLSIGRLAFFLTDSRDWAEVFREDITSLEQRADFLLSTLSGAYALRERIKERTLTLVPGYKPYIARQNQVNFQVLERSRKPEAHTTLQRLLGKARARGTRLVFIAFPTRGRSAAAPYDVADETRRLIADSGMIFLDMRGLRRLEPRHYADNVHLTEEGRTVYTRHLAESLRDLMPLRSGPGTRTAQEIRTRSGALPVNPPGQPPWHPEYQASNPGH
jgi:hypothetical protein